MFRTLAILLSLVLLVSVAVAAVGFKNRTPSEAPPTQFFASKGTGDVLRKVEFSRDLQLGLKKQLNDVELAIKSGDTKLAMLHARLYATKAESLIDFATSIESWAEDNHEKNKLNPVNANLDGPPVDDSVSKLSLVSYWPLL